MVDWIDFLVAVRVFHPERSSMARVKNGVGTEESNLAKELRDKLGSMAFELVE